MKTMLLLAVLLTGCFDTRWQNWSAMPATRMLQRSELHTFLLRRVQFTAHQVDAVVSVKAAAGIRSVACHQGCHSLHQLHVCRVNCCGRRTAAAADAI
jgi:hypothetical protein